MCGIHSLVVEKIYVYVWYSFSCCLYQNRKKGKTFPKTELKPTFFNCSLCFPHLIDSRFSLSVQP